MHIKLLISLCMLYCYCDNHCYCDRFTDWNPCTCWWYSLLLRPGSRAFVCSGGNAYVWTQANSPRGNEAIITLSIQRGSSNQCAAEAISASYALLTFIYIVIPMSSHVVCRYCYYHCDCWWLYGLETLAAPCTWYDRYRYCRNLSIASGTLTS